MRLLAMTQLQQTLVQSHGGMRSHAIPTFYSQTFFTFISFYYFALMTLLLLFIQRLRLKVNLTSVYMSLQMMAALTLAITEDIISQTNASRNVGSHLKQCQCCKPVRSHRGKSLEVKRFRSDLTGTMAHGCKLQPSGNTVLFEEIGGNLAQISFATRQIGSLCSHVYKAVQSSWELQSQILNFNFFFFFYHSILN